MERVNIMRTNKVRQTIKIILVGALALIVMNMSVTVSANDFHTDETATEKIENINVMESETEIQPINFRNGKPAIHVGKFLNVASSITSPGRPRSERIWHVHYEDGVKYEGYLEFTGITKVDDPENVYYRFAGLLQKAD